MKQKLFIKTTLSISLAFLSSNLIGAEKKSNLIESMPWASAISIDGSEFVDNGKINNGTAGTASFTQSIRLNHVLKKYFEMGFYVKGAYLTSDDTQRYWENKTETSYGIEFVKTFSNDVINWGQVKLILGKKKDSHHDAIGEPFDAKLNEIRIQLTTTGDLLK